MKLSHIPFTFKDNLLPVETDQFPATDAKDEFWDGPK